MKLNTTTKWGLALLMAAGLSACSTTQKAKTATVANKAAGTVAEASGPSQAEIIHVVTTMNNSEIEAAQLARSKSKDPKVLQLADHIIQDHTNNNKQAMSLADQMNLQPDNNEISRSIRAGSSMTMSGLKKAEGADFDQAYMDQQARMHQSTLDTIDKHLLPNAKDANLKAFLEKTRRAVASHLQNVQQMQRMSGSSSK